MCNLNAFSHLFEYLLLLFWSLFIGLQVVILIIQEASFHPEYPEISFQALEM